MDKSLERSIYDHQVKKQQMSNRLLDKTNPLPFMSMKNAAYSYFKHEEQSPLQDFSASAINYEDTVIKNLLRNFPTLLSETPAQHDSLLIDRDENKLSDEEGKLAIIDD